MSFTDDYYKHKKKKKKEENEDIAPVLEQYAAKQSGVQPFSYRDDMKLSTHLFEESQNAVRNDLHSVSLKDLELTRQLLAQNGGNIKDIPSYKMPGKEIYFNSQEGLAYQEALGNQFAAELAMSSTERLLRHRFPGFNPGGSYAADSKAGENLLANNLHALGLAGELYGDMAASAAVKLPTYFKGSSKFKDGYDFGDVTLTILGSAADVVENVEIWSQNFWNFSDITSSKPWFCNSVIKPTR